MIELYFITRRVVSCILCHIWLYQIFSYLSISQTKSVLCFTRKCNIQSPLCSSGPELCLRIPYILIWLFTICGRIIYFCSSIVTFSLFTVPIWRQSLNSAAYSLCNIHTLLVVQCFYLLSFMLTLTTPNLSPFSMTIWHNWTVSHRCSCSCTCMYCSWKILFWSMPLSKGPTFGHSHYTENIYADIISCTPLDSRKKYGPMMDPTWSVCSNIGNGIGQICTVNTWVATTCMNLFMHFLMFFLMPFQVWDATSALEWMCPTTYPAY